MLVELDRPELPDDARHRALSCRKRLNAKNAGRNHDLSVIAEVWAKNIGHVGIDESRGGAAGKLNVQVVVQLESRLNDAGLDAGTIYAGHDSASSFGSAIAIGVRCGFDLAAPNAATTQAHARVRRKGGGGAAQR